MNCPIDNTQLQMSERSGVEIDYCPQCRGVWLDRGELDKLINKADSQPRVEPRERSKQEYDEDDHQGGYGRGRRKEGFLGELFDF